MKKIISSCVIVLTLISNIVVADGLKIGFANRTLNGAFFNGLTEYMKIHAKESGYELITTNANGDMSKQINDVEDMLSQKIDYLILNPQDPVAGLQITKKAAAAGIPVLILDSDISLDAPVITRVQANNQLNNYKIGEYAVDKIGNKPLNIVFISGSQGSLVGEARRTNFIVGVLEASLRKYNQSNVNVLAQVWGNWDQQGGLKAMEDAIIAHGDKINVVYTEMDDMALGAVRALKAAGKLENVKVFSHDGYKYGLEAIKRGELQATASNNPNMLTKLALEIVSQHKAGARDFPDYTYIPSLLITKDNVGQVYDEQSLY